MRIAGAGGFPCRAVALIAFEIVLWRGRAARWRPTTVVCTATLVIAVGALALTLTYEAQFRWVRHRCAARRCRRTVEQLGRHFIVGYRDLGRVARIWSNAAPSPASSSPRTMCTARTLETIRREIDAPAGDPPAAGTAAASDRDRPGGRRRSRACRRRWRGCRRSARSCAATHDAAGRALSAVRQYAAEQGRALARLGFNLNFAPVVDLNHNVVNPNDRYTRISDARDLRRSEDRHRQSRGEYCYGAVADRRALHAQAFPRPRPRVRGHASRNRPICTRRREELADTDWMPFRDADAMQPGAFTMLGHARLIGARSRHARLRSPRRSSRVCCGGIGSTTACWSPTTSAWARSIGSAEGMRGGERRGAQCRRRPHPDQL